MNAPPQITGGCFCGETRYSFADKMMWPGICHCTVCCKFSGAAGGAWFGVLRESVTINGEIAFWQYTADSGNTIHRGCCARCRSPVYNTNSMMEDVFIFAAGSLDSPDEYFLPRMRIYTDSAPDWVMSAATGAMSLPEFGGMAISERK